MRYQMKLRSQPFEMIRSGKKTFELRLYDEKRQQIKVDDEIEFSCADAEKEPFVVVVTAFYAGGQAFPVDLPDLMNDLE